MTQAEIGRMTTFSTSRSRSPRGTIAPTKKLMLFQSVSRLSSRRLIALSIGVPSLSKRSRRQSIGKTGALCNLYITRASTCSTTCRRQSTSKTPSPVTTPWLIIRRWAASEGRNTRSLRSGTEPTLPEGLSQARCIQVSAGKVICPMSRARSTSRSTNSNRRRSGR